jgi:HSP20 family protein
MKAAAGRPTLGKDDKEVFMAISIARRGPLADLNELRDWFDQGLGNGEGWNPRIDVVKKEGELILRADLPGIKPDEIEVEVEDGVLTLSGEHEEKTEKKEERFLRRERRFGSFSRSMTLPEGVKPEDIKATTTDGVLELRIPVPGPEAKPTQKVKVHPQKA